MSAPRISRVVVGLASVFFAVVALALWVAPDHVAHALGLETVRATGTAVVRADLGGLFAAMALMCAAAAWTKSAAWTLAATSALIAVSSGRLIGWLMNREVGRDVVELAIELTIIAALFGMARTHSAPRRRAPAVLSMLMTLPVIGGAAAWLSPDVQQRLFDRVAMQRAAAINTAPLEDDALRVAVCGSSAPLASAPRAKACVAVFAGGKFYIVDAGPESTENLVLWGIPLSSIGGVLLTHFHSDHIGDLGELNLQTWAGGRPLPLDVYGGPGVDAVVDGFNRAYRVDQGYRTAHHSERVMPPATWPMIAHEVSLDGPATPAKDRSALVFEKEGLRITAIEVDHAPIAPAYAYRFDYKGRSVLVTGDLKFHPPLVNSAGGVDLLVSEAISVSMTRALGEGAAAGGRDGAAAIMHDIEDYHITPQQAAQIANDAGVKMLVFYHLLPAPDGALARRLFGHGIDQARRGDWHIADDGSLYTLPLGSTTVRVGRVSEE
jgi:ribonuclease Z